MTKTYTVIGMYNDTGETFAEVVEEQDSWHAMRMVCSQVPASQRYNLEILGAIESAGPFQAACDDSGKAAYVCDLFDMDEEDEDSVGPCVECGTQCVSDGMSVLCPNQDCIQNQGANDPEVDDDE